MTAQTVKPRRFWTPGAFVLLAIMAVGYLFGLARFITGLNPVTNLTDLYPWGIWIGIDVASGVALAAGGFTTAALVNVFGRKKYHALERPALLTAWLGYTFVGVGLLFDLGRYYNIWHPAIYWQGNSVLFEVGMCVMAYLTVLTLEFSPTLIEGIVNKAGNGSLIGRIATRLKRPLDALCLIINRILPIFIIAGVMLSFMHQSSLGSLMLIAPSKLNSLWWTPILPVLFLMSAIMVGFPMVIFESIFASKSFGLKPEMELLTPLSRFIPWFIGAYAAVKFGDLFMRWDQLDFLAHPTDTASLIVEIGIGLLVPFVMLLQKSVRRSPFWLFIAVTAVIFGVLLNRINVFVVGFHPYFAKTPYFPAIGEIAVTVGLVSTIILLYRFFAYYFPVLEGRKEVNAVKREDCKEKHAPVMAWIARGLAVILLFSFVILYAVVHDKGMDTSIVSKPNRATLAAALPKVDTHHDPIGIPEQLSFSAETMPSLLILDRSHTNEKVDDYEPVRFMHKAHASRLNGNCNECHHRVQKDKNDRIGEEIVFTDLDNRKPASCVSCHQYANEKDAPDRPGLKGAYHEQCIGCHKKADSVNAPTDCTGCHAKRTPDHKKFITLTGNPKPQEVTARCLDCHEDVGQEVLKSAHWNWSGPSPNTKGYEHRTDLGKKDVLNNYCIHVNSNEARCAQCHVGYGWKDESFDFKNPKNIDCLVCHDTTGTYRKDAPNGGMPMKEVNIIQVAQNVGKTSRETCGACHFYGGGGANVKHGDLEPALIDPPDEFDVHMGRAGMDCQDCHRTKDHQIAGQCLAIPTSEGRVTCEQCHGENPHNMNHVVGFHLDQHSKTVACQTCHVPHFAKETPTKVHWDWSTAGKDLPETKDELGMPTYVKQKGHFEWGKFVDPCITWYDGTHERYVLGDKIKDPNVPTLLNAPVGSFDDPNAKLYPFKCYSAVIPTDAKRQVFAVPQLWKGFWDDFDWKKSLTVGMESYGQEFSGEVGFAKADMFWAINHEVVPAKKALACADCHIDDAVTCSRCHGEESHFDSEELIGPRYPESKAKLKRSDFESMGYPDDPSVTGGRFHHHTLPGTN